MIVEDLKYKVAFTRAERNIADYILNHLNDIPKYSAEMLASKTYTSKASITRLCQKLNVKGYQDLKNKLEWEKHELNRVQGMVGKEPVNEFTTLEEIQDLLPSIYDDAIVNVRLNLNQNALKRCINRLKKAIKIDIYGSGITNSVAEIAAFKFLTIGYDSAAYTGINEHYVMTDDNRKRKVAIVLSFTGNNPMMVEIAKYLRKQGVFVIGIGGENGNGIEKNCNEYFSIEHKRQILSMEILAAISDTNYIIDVFFTALLVEHYKKNVAASLDVIKNKYY